MKSNRRRILLAIFCILLLRFGFNRVLADTVIYDGSEAFDGNFAYQATQTWGNYDYTTTKVQNVTYAVITCYKGTEENVVIPSTMGGLEVIGINAETFNAARGVKKVTLPKTLQVIYDFAFVDCPTIEEIVVESGNSYYKSVDGMVYSADEKYLVVCPEGKKGVANISDKCKNICDYAFYNCANLTVINIPRVMANIGDQVFVSTHSLHTISVDSACQYFTVYDGILYNSGKTILLKCPDKRSSSVTISSNTCEIAPYAFYECYNLPGPINIPNRVDTIGEYAFSDCESLTGAINLPYTLNSLGKGAFNDCYKLESISIGSGVTEIPENCFSYCSSLTSITIPNNITTIGEQAFLYCSNVKNLNLGNRVETIADNAFYGLKSLRGDLVIPNNVKELGNAVFYGCNNLDGYIIVGSGVNSIGASQFGNPINCKGIVFLGKKPDTIDDFAFTLNNCKFYYKAQYPEIRDHLRNIDPTVLYAPKFVAKVTDTYDEKPVVKFVANGEIINQETLSRFGTKATEFEPNLEFYDVTGWYYDENYTNRFSFDDEFMHNTTVYAKTKEKYFFAIVEDSMIVETDTTEKIETDSIMRPEDVISWSSSNEDVATVDENGNVTAHTVGTAIITATTNYGSDTITINTWKDNNSLDISLDSIDIVIGESAEISYDYHLVHNGNPDDIEWTVNEDEVISLDKNSITGLKEGTVTLTATYQDVSDSITVNVLRPNELEIQSVEGTIIEDKVNKINFTYFFNDGATDEDIIWSSEDEEIAYVDNGYVTGVSEGQTQISATYKNVTSTFMVQVYPKDRLSFNVNGIKVSKEVNLYNLNDYIDFYSYGHNSSEISWESSNEDVATIENGVVDIKSVGDTVVTVSYNDITDYIIVHAIEKNTLEFAQDSQTIKKDQDELNLEYTLEYADDTDESLIHFTSDNESVLKVENNVPKVVGIGDAILYISYKDISSSKNVKVVEKDKVEVTTTAYRLLIGETEKIVIDSYSYDSTLQLESSNDEVVTVDEEGNIEAIGLGEAKITITCGEASQEVTIVVADTKFAPGDVNKDGKINSTDAARILDIYKGEPAEADEIVLADANGDGKVNSSDATEVLLIYANN